MPQPEHRFEGEDLLQAKQLDLDRSFAQEHEQVDLGVSVLDNIDDRILTKETERRALLGSDRPTSAEVKALRKHVRALFARDLGRVIRAGTPDHVVGTSKTFRSLARITGAAPSAEGPFVRRCLRHADLLEWLPKLSAMSPAERAALPGVSAGRAGQLLAGALVADAAMDLLGVQELEICPWALREGVILRRLDALA